jgi:hypothetical protein
MSTETKHTKEPWARNEHGYIYGGNPSYVIGHISQESEANARRIVACVNACAGISNEQLEDDRLDVFLQALRISTLEAHLAESKQRIIYSEHTCTDFYNTAKKYKNQLEKLSGKTGYCTECERLGRENKELREALSNEREAFYVRKVKECRAQNKELREALAKVYELLPFGARVESIKICKQALDKALSGGG